jgi:dipeptidase E
MKLLLTSSGISNKSIENALRKLINGEIKIAFIPTAANEYEEDKDWLTEDLNNLKKLGSVNLVDISVLDKKEWLPRLKEANVILFGGGDTSYLMNWILKSGLAGELPKLMKKRVCVGISAGSIIFSKEIQADSENLYGDEIKNPPKGLGYVNFHIRPHVNSKYFPKVNDKNLRELSKKLSGDLYALDDDSAVLYNDGKIEVISEGKWTKYPKKI